MFRKVLVFGFLLLSWNVSAQLEITNTPVSDTLKPDLTKYIPPLYMLIDSAIANHPEVRRWQYEAESFEHTIKATKYDYLIFTAGGNYNYFFINDPTISFFGIPNSISGRVEVSLNDLATRKHRRRSLQAQAKSDLQGSENAKRLVAAEVTMLYNNLFMYQRMLEVNQKAIQMGRMGVELGEEKFRNGQIQLAELSQLYDLMTKYGLEYERSYAAYKSAYTDLERLVGVPLSKFKF